MKPASASSSDEDEGLYIERDSVSSAILKDALRKFCPEAKAQSADHEILESNHFQGVFESEFDLLCRSRVISQAMIEMVLTIKELERAQT